MPRIEWGRVVMRSDRNVDTGWMEKAACRGEPTELFFFDERIERKRVAEAKAVCDKCPVWKNCLNYAIETPIDFGIWGGFTSKERERLRWRQQKARQSAPRPKSGGAR